MRYLVDTSVWIDFLNAGSNGNGGPHVRLLDGLLEPPSRIVLTPIVLQEILQGTRDEAIFRRYQRFFGSQQFILAADPLESHIEAARIFFHCRRAGVTIRSSIDCMIGRIAIENDAMLLHNDEDFRRIARVTRNLRETSG